MALASCSLTVTTDDLVGGAAATPGVSGGDAQVVGADGSRAEAGTLPDATKQIGILLATATESFPNKVVPQVLYDGIVDAKITTNPENPMQICIQNNGGSAFANLHLDKLDKNKPDLPGIMSLDAKPYDCSLPAIAPVTFPGL